jgi:hypothetical protein
MYVTFEDPVKFPFAKLSPNFFFHKGMQDVCPTILFFLAKVGLWGVKLESIIGLCNLQFCHVRYYIPKCMPRMVVH